MKNIFNYLLIGILIAGCQPTSEKEFRQLEPIELGEALKDIDSLDDCKKQWVTKKIISYHSLLKNDKQSKNQDIINNSDYYRETLNDVYHYYSKQYNNLVNKWQSVYDINQRIKELIQIDTAYVVHNKSGDLHFITEFKPNQEIEEASFSITYRFWYNYENSVVPDKNVTAYADYRLAGHVFQDTIRIKNTARSGIFEDFLHRFKSIGTNGVIKGKKSDEFTIDYASSKVILTNGQKLNYGSLNSMPADICINENSKK